MRLFYEKTQRKANCNYILLDRFLALLDLRLAKTVNIFIPTERSNYNDIS